MIPTGRALWVAPVLGALGAGLLAAGALALDHAIAWEAPPLPLFSGQADTARDLLAVIATAVTTLIALIFTILTVAIQLASSQYSPRVLSSLLQDRPSHFTIGVFVGTFTYSLVVLFALRVTAGDDGERVAGVALTLAFVLAVISIATFAMYSNHIIHSVRVTSLINRLARETREEIERLYPHRLREERAEPPPSPAMPVARTVDAPRAGVLTGIDLERLYEAACRSGSTLQVVTPLGTFMPQGYPLIEVSGGDPGELLRYVDFSDERILRMDVAFGLRQLGDIAVRALSSGINDPATAVQVLDQLHDLLRRLVVRELDYGTRRDPQGVVRVALRTPTWQEMLHVAVVEIRIYGAGSLQVGRRLRAVLQDLEGIAPPSRRQSLAEQMALLDAAIERGVEDPQARRLAREGDLRGTGF